MELVLNALNVITHVKLVFLHSWKMIVGLAIILILDLSMIFNVDVSKGIMIIIRACACDVIILVRPVFQVI